MVSEKDRLVNKSIEAFILGLEIYNKPTIRYRVEGFSFFVVNAWELMLKAEMLNRGLSIFYDVKREQRFAYKHTIGKQEQFTYSQQFIEFILGEMKKNPNTFVESLRKSKR